MIRNELALIVTEANLLACLVFSESLLCTTLNCYVTADHRGNILLSLVIIMALGDSHDWRVDLRRENGGGVRVNLVKWTEEALAQLSRTQTLLMKFLPFLILESSYDI